MKASMENCASNMADRKHQITEQHIQWGAFVLKYTSIWLDMHKNISLRKSY